MMRFIVKQSIGISKEKYEHVVKEGFDPFIDTSNLSLYNYTVNTVIIYSHD